MRFMTELTKSQVLDGICFDQVVITKIKIDIFQYILRKNEYYKVIENFNMFPVSIDTLSYDQQFRSYDF
jgi:hypothetical protein